MYLNSLTLSELTNLRVKFWEYIKLLQTKTALIMKYLNSFRGIFRLKLLIQNELLYKIIIFIKILNNENTFT